MSWVENTMPGQGKKTGQTHSKTKEYSEIVSQLLTVYVHVHVTWENLIYM